MRRAVFLDRDGTINEDPGYLSDPEQLRLFPGVDKALGKLHAAGYLLVVVSNQSGVGRGLIPEGALAHIHAKLDRILETHGTRIDRYELCLHHPEDGCDCRKPQPKLILNAAEALDVDLKKSYMIGDKTSDIQAGIRAGCKGTLLVRTGEGIKSRETGAAFVAASLVEAANWILEQDTKALEIAGS
ncbi:MAG: D-glycero-beta-D-manno-heptose 1,7-bisphosphate 7-phosphatase [Oligoflexia bacterium]|nr:D-glycero-beta-D-manno-heptose 1,7-bisphosphate 7-phosphatase [Oligoflexia bacterium]